MFRTATACLLVCFSCFAGAVQPDFTLSTKQTHNRFSAAIEPAIRVPPGSIIEAYTHEATGGVFKPGSGIEDLHKVEVGHTITGPVFVTGARPGDVIAVEILEIEVGSWGWMAHLPQLGLLAGEFEASAVRTFELNKATNSVRFKPGIEVPLKPFPGIMGVAPSTTEALSTVPPRANGGNLDDPNIGVGTTVYFPVFIEGALFSIGDTHAVQGHGEVSGTAMEAPMRIVYRIDLLANHRAIAEPQYETADYFATTAFGETLDQAAQKATRYMIDYLVAERSLTRLDAYMLCSLAGDLKIAEVVNTPHKLVAMHMPKNIFTTTGAADAQPD